MFADWPAKKEKKKKVLRDEDELIFLIKKVNTVVVQLSNTLPRPSKGNPKMMGS